MITIRLPPEPVLITEQCHKGVTVGQGKTCSACYMCVWSLLLEEIPLWWWIFPVWWLSALGKAFKTKVGQNKTKITWLPMKQPWALGSASPALCKTPVAWAHTKGRQERSQPCALRGGGSGQCLGVKGTLCLWKQKSRKEKAHGHFDSSWRKHRALPLCLLQRMVSEEVGQQGREETLGLTHRLRAGTPDCLGGDKALGVVGRWGCGSGWERSPQASPDVTSFPLEVCDLMRCAAQTGHFLMNCPFRAFCWIFNFPA